ncbi:hypothetical protein EDF79_2293 [Raoultella terrigena]|nr:hypothetical protein EDF79_2293 [Raoultella terrigena]
MVIVFPFAEGQNMWECLSLASLEISYWRTIGGAGTYDSMVQ